MNTPHNSILDPFPVEVRTEVQHQLEDILRSGPFRTSRQCQDLFRYMVEHSLAGSDHALRERIIGIEVFGRVPDYNTAEDPVVRVRAADVRKRLAQYYQVNGAEVGAWKIEIPTGSYKAHFHRLENSGPGVAPSQRLDGDNTERPIPAVALARKAGPFKAKLSSIFFILAVATAAVAVFLIKNNGAAPRSAFDLFWEPALRDSRPVLVCIGSNRVYRLSEKAIERYRTHHHTEQEDTPNLETLVPRTDLGRFTGDDFIPVKDTYLTIGDASATAQISSLLASRRRAVDLRFGSDISFSDLREGSAVLIGAFNNGWTLSMTRNLRFVFDGGDTPQMHVQDRFDRSRSWWPKISNGKFNEDYAIVSRILDSKTGSVLVTIAGLDQSGTRAAGNFATSQQLIEDFVKHAPKDWNKSNMQVVLHTTVTNDIPDLPTVVAAYYW